MEGKRKKHYSNKEKNSSSTPYQCDLAALSNNSLLISGVLLHEWQRVIVQTKGEGGTRRAFVLEPGPTENELAHGPFSVKGRFVINEKANSPKRADEVWKTEVVA